MQGRRFGVLALLMSASSIATASGKDDVRKPNLLLIVADQMRASALGAVGNPDIRTPHLDALAAGGILFTNAIASAPVCSPSRAQIMTGRYAYTTGVIHNDLELPDQEITLAELLRSRGYRTGYIGKWHLSGDRDPFVPEEKRQGWEYWAVRNVSHEHFDTFYYRDDPENPIRLPGWEPDGQTDLAIQFLERNRERPFCLMLSYGPPHDPYVAPPRWADRYPPESLRTRPNVPEELRHEVRAMLAQYYGMITGLDENVGRLMKALEALELAEDTIVLFTSDHGDMLGSQGHWLKQRPWEESIRIPLILRYPRRVAPNQTKDWIFSTVDVTPTLLGLVGAPIPANIEGFPYAPTILGESDREREAAFLFNVHRGGGPGMDWRGIRTKSWVYAYGADGDWVLYDLREDPFELVNLVDDPRYEAEKRRLRARVESWRSEIRDDRPLARAARR
jgi:arylsulfatase A-like enzyme